MIEMLEQNECRGKQDGLKIIEEKTKMTKLVKKFMKSRI